MTIVIAVKTEDAIVMTSDGKVTRNDKKGTVRKLTQRKIFHIKNGICFGVAAAGIYPGEIESIAKWMRLYLPCVPPYTMKDVAILFSNALAHIYKDHVPEFWMDIILAGYGRDKHGLPTEPLIFGLKSKENFSGRSSPKIAIGDIKEGDFTLDELPEVTDELVPYAQNIIRKIEKTRKGVGGDIRTVIIKDMGKKKFKELIKKASQPVPKEQDKQARPDSYNEKQTHSHKSANTSAKRRGKSHEENS